MKILIVEDEAKTAAYLQKGLSEQGFTVEHVANGTDALHLIQESHYDLVILDVMIPGLNGWEVIQQIREQNKQMPVLFLTARDDVEDRVKGLRLGADDYLVKPFAFSELVARLHTLLRRGQVVQTDCLQVADLTIDLMKHKAYRQQQLLNLTSKEYALLLLLVRHQGEPLSRTYIAEKVWDIHFQCDTNVIDVAVKRLRQKVDKPFGKQLIHTVRGVGYVLDAL
ncbi:MAG: heavy metal response regulator transcription factor [Gammaproteobacteria bacterium]